MSGLEVIGSIASVMQLAGAVYSISIQLYEVANALSNAPADIKDLAYDLEIFSEELILHSKLVNANNSRYSAQINNLTAKIIGRCATICERIDRVLKKLRSGSVLARLKWLYKEKEIRKLLDRLRHLKLSLMETLSLLRTLKADHMMDAMGVQAPSLLDGPQDEELSRKTMEEMENTRKKLESITMDQHKLKSLSGTTLIPQTRRTSSITDKASEKLALHQSNDFSTFKSTSLQSCVEEVPRTVEEAVAISPFISTFSVPEKNTVMQNPDALESVQSFHSALSYQESPLENTKDDVSSFESAEPLMIPSIAADVSTTFANFDVEFPQPIHDDLTSNSTITNVTNSDVWKTIAASNSDDYKSWQNDLAEATAKRFNLARKDAEAVVSSMSIPTSPQTFSRGRSHQIQQILKFPILKREPPEFCYDSINSDPFVSKLDSFDDSSLQMPSARIGSLTSDHISDKITKQGRRSEQGQHRSFGAPFRWGGLSEEEEEEEEDDDEERENRLDDFVVGIQHESSKSKNRPSQGDTTLVSFMDRTDTVQNAEDTGLDLSVDFSIPISLPKAPILAHTNRIARQNLGRRQYFTQGNEQRDAEPIIDRASFYRMQPSNDKLEADHLPPVPAPNAPPSEHQLWWQAFKQLLRENPTTRLHDEWLESHPRLESPTREAAIGHAAINSLIMVLDEAKLFPLQGPAPVSESIQQILDIAKVVQTTLDLTTGAFIWTCLHSVIKTCLQGGPGSLSGWWRVLPDLAQLTTLVARYNVMESIYHQWPGMTLNETYEKSLINVCVEVLRYLDTVYTHKSEASNLLFSDKLHEIMYDINRADTASRGFNVTIIQDDLQFTLDDLEDDDSDLGETIEVESRGKRTMGVASDNPDGFNNTAVGLQEEVFATEESQPSAKRVKI